MQKWEYLFATFHTDGVLRVNAELVERKTGLVTFLREVGKGGWELVSSMESRDGILSLFFKKPSSN